MQRLPSFGFRILFISLFCFSISLFASACSSIDQPPTTVLPGTSLPEPEKTLIDPAPPFESRTATPAFTNQDNVPPQYKLIAELNYPLHQVTVQETITYPNHSKDTLREIILMVEPNRYEGTFQLQDIFVNGDKLANPPTLQSNQMHVALDQPLQPQQTLTLSISYQLDLPKPNPSPTTRPVPFGWTERQTNLVDWYPFIPPYIEGKGWLAHQPGYFGEHLAYQTANFDVTIINSGKEILRAPKTVLDRGETQPGQLTIAASAPAEQNDNDKEIHYVLPKARTFVWSVSHTYVIQTEKVGDILVLGYAFPIHAQAGEAALKATAQSLELFQKLFGPYPHPTLSVVEADFLDGMEYDGLYFLSNGFYNLYQGNPTEYLISIAAHETSHQWWFGLVGNDQAEEPWLDESFATYSEKLFYEHIYPEAQTWWWTYRIDFFNPSGYLNNSIYSYTNTPSPYEAYRNAVYLNGAKFLEDLRKTIGDEAFFNFLKSYVQNYQYKIVTTKDFFTLLRENTQVNLDNLILQYFDPTKVK